MGITKSVFELGYELSPIIFRDGAFASFPGGMAPIIAIMEAELFVQGLLNGSLTGFDSSTYPRFIVQPGVTLANNAIATYPFANQTVAANAVITQPLSLAVLMLNPVNTEGGFTSKLATMTLLKNTIDNHTQMGGTYTVATPSYIFQNLLLTSLQSVPPPAATKQVQAAWQFNFVQPLISEQDASNVLSNLMGKLNNFLQNDGSISGPSVEGSSAAEGTFNIPSLQSVLGNIGGGLTTVTNGIGSGVSSVTSSLGL